MQRFLSLFSRAALVVTFIMGLIIFIAAIRFYFLGLRVKEIERRIECSNAKEEELSTSRSGGSPSLEP